jgi:hypothetical protein
MASQHDGDAKYEKTDLTQQERDAIPRMLEFLAKQQNLVDPTKLAELGLKLSWEPFKGRPHPVIRSIATNKIKSLFPSWKLGDPIDCLLGPVKVKPFTWSTHDMMEDGKLTGRQTLAANAYEGNDEQFEIMRGFLEVELAQCLADWNTPGEDGESYGTDAEKILDVIRDAENTKMYSAIGPKSDKYGDGIKLRCNPLVSNPAPDRGLDQRSKDNMKYLPLDEQELIVNSLKADGFTKSYSPMQVLFSDNTPFDPTKLRPGFKGAFVYSFYAVNMRSTKKGKSKVTGGTVCRRCPRLIVFANGPSDSFSGIGRGLASFFTGEEPEPADAATAVASPEKPADIKKRKLEAIAAVKAKRLKAKRDAES